MKRYIGTPPTACDICKRPITNRFYDMATTMGPWANMCPTCALAGPGIGKCGTGRGQQYRREDDGKFYKIEG